MHMQLTKESQIYKAKIQTTKERSEEIKNYIWTLHLPFTVINKTTGQKTIKNIKT